MAIKNSVSNYSLSTFVDSISVFDCHGISGVSMLLLLAEPSCFYRLDNASLTIHISTTTLKENIQERELTIYMYNCNSSQSITSVGFYKKLGLC